MRTQRIVVVYAAPIPVGHAVEVRWYARSTAGIFGTSTVERAAEPVIVDRVTGIEWVSDHAHAQADGIRVPDQPIALADAPSGEVIRSIRGVVRACRVVHVRRYSTPDVQTELCIELEG